MKPIIAPTIAENITLMRLSYTHFSRLDTLTDVSKKAIKICYRFRGTPQLQTNVFSMKGVAEVLHLCTSTIDYMSSFIAPKSEYYLALSQSHLLTPRFEFNTLISLCL